MTRTTWGRSRRWVVKLGSSLVTDEGRGLDGRALDDWVSQIAALRGEGREVVLVSSGSVAEGMARLGWRERPSALHTLQAAAAVGQMGLVQAYESRFKQYGLHTAQILFTHDDITDRSRYLNARSTLRKLLELGVVPVVNENDTVATEGIRFGDNDTLAALAVNLIEADLLVILTDQRGLYDADPRSSPDARLIQEAQAGEPSLEALVSGGTSGRLGRGGMLTKIQAAARAARSGAATIIAHGRDERVLARIARGEAMGTLLKPGQARVAARKRWIAGHLRVRGQLTLDEGAAKVVREQGRSLLAVGVKAVSGRFARGDVVACMDPRGVEVARGLVNYSSDEVALLAGHPSGEIAAILGYEGEPELIHRDNMVLAG